MVFHATYHALRIGVISSDLAHNNRKLLWLKILKLGDNFKLNIDEDGNISEKGILRKLGEDARRASSSDLYFGNQLIYILIRLLIYEACR